MSRIYTYISIIVLSLVPISTIFAQDNTQGGLPEGAIARLGKGSINVMQFSSDGKYLAVGTSIGVWLYDVNTRNAKALFPAQPTRVNNHEIESVVLEEWNVHTIAQVDSLAFSPDNRILASGGSSNSVIRLWEIETGNELLYIPLYSSSDGVPAMTFSKDSKTLITPNQFSCIYHLDVTDGKLITKHKGRSADNEPLEDGYYGEHYRDLIAFTHDNKTFISGDPENGKIRLWDAVTGYQLAIFKAKTPFALLSWKKRIPQKGVNALTFSPDRKTVASGIFTGQENCCKDMMTILYDYGILLRAPNVLFLRDIRKRLMHWLFHPTVQYSQAVEQLTEYFCGMFKKENRRLCLQDIRAALEP